MQIRRERPEDAAAIRAVHCAAFGGDTEADLVERLRAGSWWLPRLSLVAIAGNEPNTVVGHVVATRARLQPSGAAVLGLGPLGVLPSWQRRGVGTALMHAVLGAAEALDETLVGLVGDPGYYGRFGFSPAAEFGVVAPDPAWGVAFQVRPLAGPVPGGAFQYAEPFSGLS